ncbi:MAG: alpha-hydroxy-acid oxidizing protein [bacterium]
MNYAEILKNARENMNGNCKACRICNGEACRGVMPGPGGKATGDGFTRAYQKLQEIKVHMDTLYEEGPIDTGAELFGRTFKYPFFAAPIAGVGVQYGPKYSAEVYTKGLVRACAADGIGAFIYDDPNVLPAMTEEDKAGGCFIPTVKPWPVDYMLERFKLAEEMGAMAVATDIDGAGLALVQGKGRPVGPKSVEQIRTLVKSVNIPVLVKGIMTVQGARKAAAAGVYGLVVSTHGGRVQDQTPAPIEMLPEIAEAVGGQVKIFMDGGVRSGVDVFKCLALGADAVLIGRPYPVMFYGAEEEGVHFFNRKVGGEFREAMMMTASKTRADINPSKLFFD